ncbi:MAG: hypothetical protein WC773_02650 [Patescibacteria group bacterium]
MDRVEFEKLFSERLGVHLLRAWEVYELYDTIAGKGDIVTETLFRLAYIRDEKTIDSTLLLLEAFAPL